MTPTEYGEILKTWREKNWLHSSVPTSALEALIEATEAIERNRVKALLEETWKKIPALLRAPYAGLFTDLVARIEGKRP